MPLHRAGGGSIGALRSRYLRGNRRYTGLCKVTFTYYPGSLMMGIVARQGLSVKSYVNFLILPYSHIEHCLLVLYHCLEVKTRFAFQTSNPHAVWQAILRASLQHSSFSVEKFSRWLRTICTISLSRNTEADRTKAIGYIEQALTVIEDHSESLGDNKVSTLLMFEWSEFSECLPRFTPWMNVNGC